MADAAAYAPHNAHNGRQLPPPKGECGSPARLYRMCGRLPLYLRRGSRRPQWRVVGPGCFPGSGGALHDTHDGEQPQPGPDPGCWGPGLARTCEPLSQTCFGCLLRENAPGAATSYGRMPLRNKPHAMPTMADSYRLLRENAVARHTGTGCMGAGHYTSAEAANSSSGRSLARVLAPKWWRTARYPHWRVAPA